MHIPQRVRRVTINPELCVTEMWKGRDLPFDSTQNADRTVISGDIDIFPAQGDHAMVQIEAWECVPFSRATPSDDRCMFSSTVWLLVTLKSKAAASLQFTTERKPALTQDLERAALMYLHDLNTLAPADHSIRKSKVFSPLFTYGQQVLSSNSETPNGSLRVEGYAPVEIGAYGDDIRFCILWEQLC
jgi:hybrid polyketide synthase/nonribosomal peptide synthetase ACE1